MKLFLVLAGMAAACSAQFPETFLGEVSIGSGPADICISPDGTRAYAAVGWGFAAVVDIDGYDEFSLAGLVNIDGEPSALQCDGTGEYLYVADGENSMVYVVNTSTLSIETSFAVEPSPEDMVLCSGENRIFIAHYGGMITVINTDTREPEAVFWAGEQLRSLAVSPDDSVIYASDNGSPEESVISAGTYTVNRVTSGVDTRCCALSGNGEKLYLSCTEWGLVGIMSTEDFSIDTMITCTGFAPSGMICLPDLPFLYGINSSENALDVYSTADFTPEGTIAVTGEPVGIAVHPDGERIFTVCDDSRLRVYGFDPAGVQSGDTMDLISIITSPSPSPVVLVTGSQTGSVSVLCHDLSGRLLFKRELEPGCDENESVRLNRMPAGVLLVTAENGERRETVRVVVLQP